MERESLVQVFKVEELKRYGQYRVTAQSLGRQNRYSIQFLTTNKDDYPMGTWVSVKLSDSNL